jgi:hypothetical protein
MARHQETSWFMGDGKGKSDPRVTAAGISYPLPYACVFLC